MIIALTLISGAFLWLLIETRFLTLRLEAYGSRTNPKLLNGCKPVLMLDTVHFKPSSFVQADMPDMSGDIEILCKVEY